MSANTSIEWTDRSWNVFRGCSRVSAGCAECYAMKLAHRFSGAGKPYDGLTTIRKGKVDWSGRVRFILDAIDEPLSWRKPQRIFVNSMSDLFHRSIPDEEIDIVLATMGACDDLGLGHTFQVLTKRADRASEYMNSPRARQAWNSRRMNRSAWPARNLHLGVSVEDQKAADDRIPYLLKCPATVRFISAEPLLGSVSLFAFLRAEIRDMSLGILGVASAPGLDWVIVGGESGPGARRFDVQWARDIVRECRQSGVAVFVKQLGSRPVAPVTDAEASNYGERLPLRLKHTKGADPLEWWEELRVREFPTVAR